MSPTSQFQIGHVIYVLSNKTQSILPGIVLEEIYHKRLDGSTFSYKIAIGPPGKQKVIDLTKVDGEVYGSLDNIKEVLVAKLTSFVDDLCTETAKRVEAWYGDQQNSATNVSSGEKVDPSVLLNEVGSSQQYTQMSQQPVQQQQYAQPMNNNQQTLRNRMTDPELMQRELEMPDGSIQKVSINLHPKQG